MMATWRRRRPRRACCQSASLPTRAALRAHHAADAPFPDPCTSLSTLARHARTAAHPFACRLTTGLLGSSVYAVAGISGAGVDRQPHTASSRQAATVARGPGRHAGGPRAALATPCDPCARLSLSASHGCSGTVHLVA
eukprot:2602517-Prymnesium_polylepis.1